MLNGTFASAALVKIEPGDFAVFAGLGFYPVLRPTTSTGDILISQMIQTIAVKK